MVALKKFSPSLKNNGKTIIQNALQQRNFLITFVESFKSVITPKLIADFTFYFGRHNSTDLWLFLFSITVAVIWEDVVLE